MHAYHNVKSMCIRQYVVMTVKNRKRMLQKTLLNLLMQYCCRKKYVDSIILTFLGKVMYVNSYE
jgi:hypothetical protein